MLMVHMMVMVAINRTAAIIMGNPLHGRGSGIPFTANGGIPSEDALDVFGVWAGAWFRGVAEVEACGVNDAVVAD